MSVEEADSLLEPAATRVRDPLSNRSVWLAGMVKEARVEAGSLKFTLVFQKGHSREDRKAIQEAVRVNLEGLGWAGEIICNVRIEGSGPAPAPTPPPEAKKDPVRGMSGPGMQAHGGPISKQPLAGVKHIVAVASGKGGVGKSTVACNLACSLALQGHHVGLMDADIYGPSLPIMMKVTGKPMANADKKIIPLMSYGVKCMSIGFLVDDTEPVIWRGPMVMGVVKQFLQDVSWAPLDFLIIDLPPGTGDAQLTMIQAVPISGAVIVTTPQEVALADAVRGIEMFRKLDVPVLGIIENMSWYALPDGSRDYPFGDGGGARTAARYEVPLLGQIPLDRRVREGGDTGAPAALAEGGIAEPFLGLAQVVAATLAV